jgi:hypothetical protein
MLTEETRKMLADTERIPEGRMAKKKEISDEVRRKKYILRPDQRKKSH